MDLYRYSILKNFIKFSSTFFLLFKLEDIVKSIRQIFSSLSGGTFSTGGCSFKNAVGHQDTKDVLTMAIQADKAYHILLKGPFGIGTTEMMFDVLNYVGKKNSHFAIGSRISKDGLDDQLIRNKNFEYLMDNHFNSFWVFLT
jgi:hypothetical protein